VKPKEGKAGIVAFAFGVPRTLKSNQIIAEIAIDRAHTLEAPVFTQLDVPIHNENKVVYASEEPDNPPPTLRIAREAVCWAQENQFTELWIAAAQPHLIRCKRDLRKAAEESVWPIDIFTCAKILDYADHDWFCPKSEQRYTRSRKNWRLREFILIHIPFWLYKIVAK
jgi:hypothetical protein